MAIAQHKTRRRELRDGRALARRVQRGDRRAFELLYTSYEGRLYRFCHRLTGSDAAAASLVEATFVRSVETLPESGLDSLDIPAHLEATARGLAYERHTNGGAPWLDPIRGEHAGEVGAANQRVSPRQRMTLALRDLEGRPDDEIAVALGADAATVAALVARARLRLREELRLPEAADGCHDHLPALSAYTDGALPADRRADLETHLGGCSGCRAALFALREAALRYRALPVPVPPGELRSRMTVTLGAVGFPTRRPRALMPDPAPAASGRPMAAAATMAALVIVGAGVTFFASRSDDGRGQATRAPASPPASAPAAASAPLSLPSRTASASLTASVTDAVNDAATTAAHAMTPRRAPPVVRHLRAGAVRPPTTAARATRPRTASSTATRPRFSGAPARTASPAAPPPPPSEPSPLPAPTTKAPKLEDIPVQILPPVAPPHTAATADAPPPPPEPPPPAAPSEPAQTTST